MRFLSKFVSEFSPRAGLAVEEFLAGLHDKREWDATAAYDRADYSGGGLIVADMVSGRLVEAVKDIAKVNFSKSCAEPFEIELEAPRATSRNEIGSRYDDQTPAYRFLNSSFSEIIAPSAKMLASRGLEASFVLDPSSPDRPDLAIDGMYHPAHPTTIAIIVKPHDGNLPQDFSSSTEGYAQKIMTEHSGAHGWDLDLGWKVIHIAPLPAKQTTVELPNQLA